MSGVVGKLQEAGLDHVQEGDGSTVSAAELAAWADRELNSFRLNNPPLSEQDEAQLAAFAGDSLRACLRRFAFVKHFYFRKRQGLTQASPTQSDPATAARQLLRREPIEVTLASGRVVRVTGRSYAALYEISRHWYRIRLLSAVLTRIAAVFAATESALDVAEKSTALSLRRRLARIEQLNEKVYLELQAQRQALYAHCFTTNGAPAAGPDEAPAWWTEIDEIGDTQVLTALWQVGPGRYQQLGDPPRPKGKTSSPAEDFGYASIIATVERQQKAEPASYYDRDLFQLLTWARASVPGMEDLEA